MTQRGRGAVPSVSAPDIDMYTSQDWILFAAALDRMSSIVALKLSGYRHTVHHGAC